MRTVKTCNEVVLHEIDVHSGTNTIYVVMKGEWLDRDDDLQDIKLLLHHKQVVSILMGLYQDYSEWLKSTRMKVELTIPERSNYILNSLSKRLNELHIPLLMESIMSVMSSVIDIQSEPLKSSIVLEEKEV
jgi:DNA-binding cell septation regulator SpoVG